MILLTGAGGKTGRAIVRALHGQSAPVRALVHRAEQRANVLALGAREALAGDMRSASTLRRAMRGVRAVYHICPNVSPDEATIGRAVIATAQAAGVEQIVYHSVLRPQIEAMPHHWQKLRVEEQLFACGLPFTILQPAPYMQNLLAQRRDIVERGVLPLPYAPQTRISPVDLADVAEVAAAVLCERGHNGAIYELCGAEAPSQSEVADLLSQRLNRPVVAEVVPIDAWARRARASGLGDYQVETLSKMFGYYERFGFVGNPRVLSGLLGRAPASYAAFLAHLPLPP